MYTITIPIDQLVYAGRHTITTDGVVVKQPSADYHESSLNSFTCNYNILFKNCATGRTVFWCISNACNVGIIEK